MFDPRIAVLALAVSGVGALGFGAYRVHAYGGFRGHRDHAMMHKFIDFTISEKLDAIGASDAQKQKVREIKDRLVKDGQALREAHGSLHEQVLGLLEKDEVDAAQLKSMVKERTEAFSRFAEEAADALVELHGVFTPEQRRQLLAEAREHRERHRH
jgi:Spy/CpxP family protein refolding chaperone